MSDYPFGEGEVRMNKATNYLIYHVRIAQKKWGLSELGLGQVMRRVREAEWTGKEYQMRLDSERALTPKNEPKEPS